MLNVGFIFQPHFKSRCFRVALQDQRGRDNNYIVVTCSPKYNGVWKYAPQNIEKYDTWQNGNVKCVCVPITDCVKVRTLQEIIDPAMKKKIKEQQSQWYDNQIKNRNYNYVERPEWMI